MKNTNPPIQIHRQRGASLFIALVALVTLTLAGLALMRSMDTGTLLAGNIAFRQASAQAAERGVQDAIAYLKKTDPLLLNQKNNEPRYYRTQQNTENSGLPLQLVNSPDSVYQHSTLGDGAYKVRYMIDRLCKKDLVQYTYRDCYTGMKGVNYRISVRVDGPRNAIAYAQVIYRR